MTATEIEALQGLSGDIRKFRALLERYNEMLGAQISMIRGNESNAEEDLEECAADVVGMAEDIITHTDNGVFMIQVKMRGRAERGIVVSIIAAYEDTLTTDDDDMIDF